MTPREEARASLGLVLLGLAVMALGYLVAGMP